MPDKDHIIEAVARRIDNAINDTLEAFREKRIKQEPNFTDRMLGAIESKIKEFSGYGIVLHAKTLTDRGSGSQECNYGADFMVVIHIDHPLIKIPSKGFLAQAKLINKLPPNGDSKLKDQCDKMLELSRSSYVFGYDSQCVIVAEADQVATSGGTLSSLNQQSSQSFFREFLKCKKGDRGICDSTDSQLDQLRKRYDAKSILSITG